MQLTIRSKVFWHEITLKVTTSNSHIVFYLVPKQFNKSIGHDSALNDIEVFLRIFQAAVAETELNPAESSYIPRPLFMCIMIVVTDERWP